MTIWDALALKLGRDPTSAEVCYDIHRILREARAERADHMAYVAGSPGKLHKAVSKKVVRPKCAPGLRTPFQRANRTYAEAMQGHGLLCKKCYPTGRLPKAR